MPLGVMSFQELRAFLRRGAFHRHFSIHSSLYYLREISQIIFDDF